jgi:hypothetical protein
VLETQEVLETPEVVGDTGGVGDTEGEEAVKVLETDRYKSFFQSSLVTVRSMQPNDLSIMHILFIIPK